MKTKCTSVTSWCHTYNKTWDLEGEKTALRLFSDRVLCAFNWCPEMPLRKSSADSNIQLKWPPSYCLFGLTPEVSFVTSVKKQQRLFSGHRREKKKTSAISREGKKN